MAELVLAEIAGDDSLDSLIANQRVMADLLSSSALMFVAAADESSKESTRIDNFVEEVVPRYSDIDFRSHFRMGRETFEKLCVVAAPTLCQEKTLALEKKVLATLWLLCNPESYRSVADRFGMSKGTLHYTVMSVCRGLASLMGEFIKFPRTRQEFQAISHGFRQRCGMPGVIGAIDGTHIPMPAPRSEIRASFINRKGQSAMQLQVVCDSDLILLDVYTGWPGSVHDVRVFQNSPLAKLLKEGDFPDDVHLLGDSAYSNSTHMLVPFKDNGHLTAQEKRFNKSHSSTRVEVERAIGLLKARFRRLKYLDMKLHDEIPVVIGTCCLLHNFILMNEDLEEVVIEPTEDDMPADPADPADPRAQDTPTGAAKRLLMSQQL